MTEQQPKRLLGVPPCTQTGAPRVSGMPGAPGVPGVPGMLEVQGVPGVLGVRGVQGEKGARTSGGGHLSPKKMNAIMVRRKCRVLMEVVCVCVCVCVCV